MDEEEVDRFCQRLKPKVCHGIMEAGAQNTKGAAIITLNVEASLFGAGMLHSPWHGIVPTRTTIDIGNLEQ